MSTFGFHKINRTRPRHGMRRLLGHTRVVVLAVTMAMALGLAATASADSVVKGGYVTVGDCQVFA
jgi:hypothetical protein